MTNRSDFICDKHGKIISNERLEFLGDAVMELIITDMLYWHFAQKNEGQLTNYRTKIVKRTTMNRLAKQMGLSTPPQKSGGQQSKDICGNTLEALIGAIYIDKGLTQCKKFVQERLINKYIPLDQLDNYEINYKAKIIEFGKKHKLNVQFKDATPEETKGQFVFQLYINDEQVSIGCGPNKKEAQKKAAQKACEKIPDFLNN